MFKFKQLLLIACITPLSILSLLAQKSFQKGIYFETKKATLRETDEAILFEIADTLNEFSDYKIEIFSSAEIGVSTAESKKLSERRAKAVMTYFIQKGIDRNKFLLAIESEANANNLKISEKEKEQSRRVEILVRYTEKEGSSVFDGLNKEKTESVNIVKSNSYDNNSGFEKTAIQKLYEEIADKPTVKTVKTSKAKTIKMEGEKGTILLIPSDALDVPEGSEVTFILREAYKMSDMLAENLTTRAGDDMLASGGMVKITAMLDGKEIQPVKPFVLMMPKDKDEPMRDSMQMFNGVRDNNGNINWRLASNGGYQLQLNKNMDLLNKKLNRYATLRKAHNLFTDTCGCDKMYVWKMPKSSYKRQKELQKQGKIQELPPRYLFANSKPLYYELYKVNSKSSKSLQNCGDTLSSFCKIIAKSKTPKVFTWQNRHKYIRIWTIKFKGKLVKDKSLNEYETNTYRQYKVKTYYQYLAAMQKEMDTLALKIIELGFERNKLDSLNNQFIKAYKIARLKEQEQLLSDFAGERVKSNAEKARIAANYYLYDASIFTWINSDYYLRESKKNLSKIETNIPNDTNTDSKLIFTERKTIFSNDFGKKDVSYSNVQKKQQAIVLSIKTEKDKAYLAMKSVETSDKKVELQYEEITPQLLKEKLKTLDKYQIKLFPNPTSDVLNIQVNATFSKIQVVNMRGQVVLEEKNLGKSEHQINVSQLPNNIYNIRVFEGEILRGVERTVVNH
jgi:Secretion system C-terminal sorting domain/OmpA family